MKENNITNNNCDSCSSANGCSSSICGSCGSTKDNKPNPVLEYNNVKNVIAVVSGKGGVGKSLVTALLANKTRRKKHSVGIIDADITGPSQPKMYGVEEYLRPADIGLLPQTTDGDIGLVSINLLMENPTDPVLWRGAVLSGAVKQFWDQVLWGDIDYIFVDMPPGTADIQQTVYQEMPIKGIIIVTSPQDLVSMIVKKAYDMAKKMNIPILGIVENMSYITCPYCQEKHYIFGESKLEKLAAEMNIPILARLPIIPEYAELCDKGMADELECDEVESIVNMILDKFPPLTDKERKHDDD